jgi:O-antigen/teichoic acid export membrane protein
LKKIVNILKSDKGWVLADQLVFSGVSFVTTLVLAKNLAIEQFGEYSSVVLYLFLLLSVSGALIVSPFQILQAKNNSKTYIPALLIMQLGICALLSAITVCIGQFYTGNLFTVVTEWPLVVALLAGFLLHDFFRRLFIATEKMKLAFTIDAINGALQLLWFAYAINTGSLTLHLSLIIVSATYIPSVLIGMASTLKAIPSVKDILHYTKQHIESGKWLLLSSFFQWWSGNFMVALSGVFLGVKALGALRLAQTLFGVLNALLQMVENYVVPIASKMYENSSGSLKHYLQHTTALSLLLVAPFVLVAMLFPREIITSLGGMEYAEYAFAIQGMALLYLVIFLGYPVRIAVRVFMLNRHFFIAYAATFAFSFLTAKAIIMQWNLSGVIMALILNQLLMLGYWQYVLAKKHFVLWK